jgi:hypothetical protein
MKTFLLLSTFILTFTFVFIASAQDSYFGIGENSVFVKPEPAQGNSAGIEYGLEGKQYIDDLTKQFTISYDSDFKKVLVVEREVSIHEIVPVATGTETIKVEELNYQYGNPDVLLSDFYYSMVLETRSYGCAWYLNYDWTNFQERLTTLGNQGFRIENIDTYGRYVFDYGGSWTQDGAGWAWVLNYTNLNSFVTVLNNWPLSVTRYRPINFAHHPNGSQLNYGAVAIADNLGFGWIFDENNTSTFMSWINTQYNSSRRLVEIELYRDGSGNLMCAAISADAGYAQQVAINLTWSQFASQNTQWINQGYRLVDFNQYYIGSNHYYAGLWNNDGIGYAYHLDYHDISSFTSAVTGSINNGFKPIMVDGYDADWALDINNEGDNLLTNFSLIQNYPNPFNEVTKITYSLPRTDFISLIVYNASGREIKTLVHKNQSAGTYSVRFEGTGLSSGVYFYKLKSASFVETKKMLLIK